MDRLKTGLSIRGDSAYCPLAFSLDSWWNCEADCHHCYFRRMNRTWGQDLRPLDTDRFRAQIHRAASAPIPEAPEPGRTPLWHALAYRKTIRWGNKTDPFQPAERVHRIAPVVFQTFRETGWTFVIQTHFTHILEEYEPEILQAAREGRVTLLPVISPGLERDWEVLERKRTTHPVRRLEWLRKMAAQGVPVGVNGEPFIPGYHTPEDFRRACQTLREYGITRYNTYNLHFNDHVAKRFHEIGLDIERIWKENQDAQWRPILRELLEIGDAEGVGVGCPDFVNSGPDRREPAPTCCGIAVPRPCRFNTHYWKRLAQHRVGAAEILRRTWDGVGDYQQGEAIVTGQRSGFYTLRDAGTLPPV